MKAEDIFLAALEKKTPAERRAYLDSACRDDPGLRAQVDGLLQSHQEAGSFLDAPLFDSPPTVDQQVVEKPGTRIGPYKLLQQVGEGGFGVVFMAEQLEPVRRKVALKVIKPGMDTRQVIARFEAERQALAMMDHPNIARVIDAGATASSRPYFVMELVRGVPITAYCDQNNLPIRERLALFALVCGAIQHAHQKGIIHRDIKPSNVLVTSQDGVATVKVIDFGVAKAMGQQLTDKTLFTDFAQMIGTPLYMSPEQAELSGTDIDTRSDIYSLGVMLYELLTGSTPVDKEQMKKAAFDEIRRIIREDEPEKPSTRISSAEAAPSIAAQRHTEPARLARLVRGELDWIVMKALEKDRNRRYETATGFAADVQRYLNDEAVLACPPSAGYRFGKFARRNRAALATAVVLIAATLVTVVALTVSNVIVKQETAQKKQALKGKDEALIVARKNAENAKAKENLATEAQQEAVENLKDALAAVDQMLTRVSEERLQYTPQMETVRRDLLEDALKFYQSFLKRKNNAPATAHQTALAHLRIGSLQYRLGDYGEAEHAYREGFALLDELEATSPLEPDIRSRLVTYYIEFSWVLANQGKLEEQEQALRQAVAIADDLLKQFSEVPSYRDFLADASNRLAGAIVGTELEEAEKILRRNLTLTENTKSFWHRAQTYQTLGVLLAKQRRYSEAEDACRQGILLFEQAATNSPSLRWTEIDLASTLQQLATVVDASGRPQEADEIYRRVIPILDKLAADFPAGPHHRFGQAVIHLHHATLLRKLHRTTDAVQAYRRTLELFEKLADDFPGLPSYRGAALSRRRELAQFLAATGRVEEAKQVYHEGAGRLEALAVPERIKALRDRGHFYADLDEWDKAIGDFTQAIELGSDDMLGVWCGLALAQLGAGRPDEYRSVCERMLERSENPWVVGICTLAPKALADLSRPVQIAEKFVAQDTQNADYGAILGQALYRNGDWKSAVQRLEASLHSGSGPRDLPDLKLILAMACHRLGRQDEAQQHLMEVTQWMEANAESLKQGTISPLPVGWAYRLGLQLLHREAEEVLKEESGAKDQESEKTKKAQ